MIPLLPSTANVLQKWINMCNIFNPHLLFIPQTLGSLICLNWSVDTALLQAPGLMSLRPFSLFYRLLDVPAILNTTDQAPLETLHPKLVWLSWFPHNMLPDPGTLPSTSPCLQIRSLLFFSLSTRHGLLNIVASRGIPATSPFLSDRYFYIDTLLSSQTQMARA